MPFFSTHNATDGLFRSKPDVYRSPPPSAFKQIGLVQLLLGPGVGNTYAPTRHRKVMGRTPGKPWSPFASRTVHCWSVHDLLEIQIISTIILPVRLSWINYNDYALRTRKKNLIRLHFGYLNYNSVCPRPGLFTDGRGGIYAYYYL